MTFTQNIESYPQPVVDNCSVIHTVQRRASRKCGDAPQTPDKAAGRIIRLPVRWLLAWAVAIHAERNLLNVENQP